MARPLQDIISHIRAVAGDPSISTTLIQTEDLLALCDAAGQSPSDASPRARACTTCGEQDHATADHGKFYDTEKPAPAPTLGEREQSAQAILAFCNSTASEPRKLGFIRETLRLATLTAPDASPRAPSEADAFLRWLALPHKVSTATKAKSDYWADQFAAACRMAHDILIRQAQAADMAPAVEVAPEIPGVRGPRPFIAVTQEEADEAGDIEGTGGKSYYRPPAPATAPTRDEIARVIFDRAVGSQHWENVFWLEEKRGCFDTADAILALSPPAAVLGREAGSLLERCKEWIIKYEQSADLSFPELAAFVGMEIAQQTEAAHSALEAAYKLHEFIAGAYVLSLADFRYLNLVSTKIKDALALSAHPSPAAAPTLGREAFIRVLASLAAAISLLERGGKAAKKAAASDKMFDQMLIDYKAALEAGRAALTAPDKGGPDAPARYTIEPSIPQDGFECWYIRDAYGTEIGSINGPQSNGRQRAAAEEIAAALARSVAESDPLLTKERP